MFGGGVAGLSAARELIERGFQVSVFERNDVFGGKARSSVPHTGTGGRRDLPGYLYGGEDLSSRSVQQSVFSQTGFPDRWKLTAEC
jgi:monoamine oxidase